MAKLTPTTWIWRDGDFVPWADAQVHVLSHSMQFGSSAFEGIRCYSTPHGPAIFRLDDHLSVHAGRACVCLPRAGGQERP